MLPLFNQKPSTPSGTQKPLSPRSHISLSFVAAILLFALSLASYGGLVFLTYTQNNSIQTLADEIKQKTDTFSITDLNNIYRTESRLVAFKDLLSKHIYTTSALRFVEDNTFPQVQFVNFAMDKTGINLSGKTSGFVMVARQLAHFESNPFIQAVEFGGLSFADGGALTFEVNLKLSEVVLHQPLQQ